MGHTVVEDVEDRIGTRIIRRKSIKTDDPQYPSGYRYALHYGYTDGRETSPGTTTRTQRSVDTNGTHPTVSPKSSSPG